MMVWKNPLMLVHNHIVLSIHIMLLRRTFALENENESSRLTSCSAGSYQYFREELGV